MSRTTQAVWTMVAAMLIALAMPLLTQLFLGLAGFVQLKTVSATFNEAIVAGAGAPLNLALAQAASVGVLFIIAFPHKSREGGFLEAVRVRPLLGGMVALCFAIGVSLQFSLAEIGNLMQEVSPVSFEELVRRYELLTPKTWWGGISALIAFVLVPPVTEELVFRGWLLPMLQARVGTPLALIWSSVLFGLVHGEWGAIMYATLGGLILGAVALRTKSTLASIAIHAGINATPLLLPVTLVRVQGFNTLTHDVEHISSWLVVLSILATAGLLTILWRSTEAE